MKYLGQAIECAGVCKSTVGWEPAEKECARVAPMTSFPGEEYTQIWVSLDGVFSGKLNENAGDTPLLEIPRMKLTTDVHCPNRP